MKSTNVRTSSAGIKVKSNVKAGGSQVQHNQTIAKGLPTKSNVKAGSSYGSHNQTMALAIKSNH